MAYFRSGIAGVLFFSLLAATGCTFWRRVDVSRPLAILPTDTIRLWYRGGFQLLDGVQATKDSIVGRRITDSVRVAVALPDVDSAKVARGPGASGFLVAAVGGAIALLFVALIAWAVSGSAG